MREEQSLSLYLKRCLEDEDASMELIEDCIDSVESDFLIQCNDDEEILETIVTEILEDVQEKETTSTN